MEISLNNTHHQKATNKAIVHPIRQQNVIPNKKVSKADEGVEEEEEDDFFNQFLGGKKKVLSNSFPIN